MSGDYTDAKKIMRIVGIILLVVGIIFAAYGFTFFGKHGDSFEESSSYGNTWFIFTGIGMFSVFVGIVLLKFSLIRPISKYIATEASPAITTASHAIGKGLKESGAMGSSAPKEVIRIKCPHCGYLESEDAEFCSKCSKKI